jgi:LysR family hydrogen peroxide-inducible transcriptional activator
MARPTSPTLPQLRALVAVSDTLNFRDAAATLQVSQPAVSAAIAGLEATVGVRLVERTTRRVRLTATGEAVTERARTALEAIDDVTRTAQAGRRPLAGPLRLGVIPTVAPYLLPTLMAGMRRDLARCRPDILEDQTARLVEQLERGRLDVAILALPAGAALTAWPLYREDFLVAVPAGHRLDGARDIPHGALAGLELLLLQDGHCLRDQVLDVCRSVGGTTTHPARTSSLTTLTRLVAAGMGATLLPASAAGVDAGPGLGLGRLRSPAPGRTIGLAHRAGAARALEYEVLTLVLRDAVRAAGLDVEVIDDAVVEGALVARARAADPGSGTGSNPGTGTGTGTGLDRHPGAGLDLHPDPHPATLPQQPQPRGRGRAERRDRADQDGPARAELLADPADDR